jgi:hypothetical protein
LPRKDNFICPSWFIWVFHNMQQDLYLSIETSSIKIYLSIETSSLKINSPSSSVGIAQGS